MFNEWINSLRLSVRFGAGLALLILYLSPHAHCQDFNFELPGYAVGGEVGYYFTTAKSGDAARSYQNAATASMVGKSYIWQPWFAGLTGALNATQFTSSVEDSGSTANAFSGRIGVAVLPLSDYPTNIEYVHTDNRTKTESSSEVASENDDKIAYSDSIDINTSVNWDQTLNFSGGMGYSKTTQEGSAEQNQLNSYLGFNKNFDKHLVAGNLNSSFAESKSLSTDSSDSSSVSNIGSVRHQYTPWTNVIYDSTSTLLFSNNEATEQTTDDLLFQTTSTLQWTPTEYPLSVTAASRSVTQKSETSITASDSTAGETLVENQSLNSRVGANYRFNDNMNFDASINGSLDSSELTTTVATDSDSGAEPIDGALIMTYGGSAGASYASDPRDILDVKWRWSSGAQTTLGGSTEADPTYALSIHTDQSFDRQFQVSYIGPVVSSLTQNLQVSMASETMPIGYLSHATNFSHSSGEDTSWTLVSFTASDSRTLSSTDQTASQLFNLQMTKGLQMGFTSTWTANLTAQLTHQGATDETEGKWDTFTQGKIGYVGMDFLGIRQLSLNADLSFDANRLTPISFSTPSEGDTDAVAWRRQFTTGLTYMIGRIRSNLRFTLSQDQTNQIADMLMFQISRGF